MDSWSSPVELRKSTPCKIKMSGLQMIIIAMLSSPFVIMAFISLTGGLIILLRAERVYLYLLLYVPLGSISVAAIIACAILKPYFYLKPVLEAGIATPATIIELHEQGKYSYVRYRFTDMQGYRIEGITKSMPPAEFLSNPTVIFDPHDSSKNFAYPSALAKVC